MATTSTDLTAWGTNPPGQRQTTRAARPLFRRTLVRTLRRMLTWWHRGAEMRKGSTWFSPTLCGCVLWRQHSWRLTPAQVEQVWRWQRKWHPDDPEQAELMLDMMRQDGLYRDARTEYTILKTCAHHAHITSAAVMAQGFLTAGQNANTVSACGCTRVYAWDKQVSADDRVHIPLDHPAHLRPCPYHAEHCRLPDGSIDVWRLTRLLDDEQARIAAVTVPIQQALGALFETDPAAFNIPTRFDADRRVRVDYPTLGVTAEHIERLLALNLPAYQPPLPATPAEALEAALARRLATGRELRLVRQ